MKKALVIFLALALVGSVFAAEPAAEVKVAEFKGDASLTFGIDLDAKETGFKNETSVTLKLNLLNGGDKSTTGDGIWGELVIKTDDDTDNFIKITKDDPVQIPMKVKVDKAQINFGPVYMGILSGDFNYGGNFWFPNALNWKDGDDRYNRNPAAKLGYDQGFVLGYKHKEDKFKVEASVRSKPTDKVAASTVRTDAPIGGVSAKGTKYYTIVFGQEVEAVGDGTKTVGQLFTPPLAATAVAYTKTEVPEVPANYWTSKYAMGVYGEVKPIKDLRIGVGAAYVLGDLSAKDTLSKDINNADNKQDISMFAGVDYLFDINDSFRIQPTLAYTLYSDYVWTSEKDGAYANALKTNKLGAGLRFGFRKAKSKDDNSLLQGFFEKEMVYNNEEKKDKTLLPGVSVYSEFDFNEGAMKKNLPLLVTFYPGELVKGLNAAAFAHFNLGPKASEYDTTTYGQLGFDTIIGGKGLQIGAAASYDVMVKDVTIVPALGMLFTHGKVVDVADKENTKTADQFRLEAKVDVKGLVDNTTFTLAWDKGSFGSYKVKAGGTSSTTAQNKKGEVTLKAKIAF
ncbi:hypothetical protein V1L52_11195 [Treponema sp. HNW]|uniref:hypothetical protein n=1 Tax=Treponema sp. HNW TaxID=3116654 RepID=UPI003D09C00E